MASVVNICNMALTHIGAAARVSSITPPDGSVEAGYCATFYPQARQAILELGNWRFAKRREALAQLENDRPDQWQFCYAKPAQCLKVKRILPKSRINVFMSLDQLESGEMQLGSAPFEEEDNRIYTNEEGAVLVFMVDVEDTTKFTPGFVVALSYYLASFLAGPIIKGVNGIRTSQAMLEQSRTATAAADAIDSNRNAEVNVNFTPSLVRARS